MRQILKTIKHWVKSLGSRIQVTRNAIHPLRKPQLYCRTAFHGSQDYGGWTLCPEGLGEGSVVYSFGVGEDASFDRSVIETYGAKVYAFDPTPRSIAWVEGQDWPSKFHFFPLGLAAQQGWMTFRPPENPEHISHTLLARPETEEQAIQVEVRQLAALAELGGHEVIDVLKMDIEGAEYQVIPDLIEQGQIDIHQILVEFHDNFPNISQRKTFQAIRQLNEAGYKIFHISSGGQEYSFIKTD